MIRTAFSLTKLCKAMRFAPVIGALLLASACTHPAQTLVDSDTLAPLVQQGSYRFSLLPQKPNATEQRALGLVQSAMQSRGWVLRDDVPYVLEVTIADRPASASIMGGDDEGRANRLIRSSAAQTRFAGIDLGGCVNRDHRLTLLLTNVASGSVHYAGSASRFHCEAALDDTLPSLVDNALADFGRRAQPRIMR